MLVYVYDSAGMCIDSHSFVLCVCVCMCTGTGGGGSGNSGCGGGVGMREVQEQIGSDDEDLEDL